MDEGDVTVDLSDVSSPWHDLPLLLHLDAPTSVLGESSDWPGLTSVSKQTVANPSLTAAALGGKQGAQAKPLENHDTQKQPPTSTLTEAALDAEEGVQMVPLGCHDTQKRPPTSSTSRLPRFSRNASKLVTAKKMNQARIEPQVGSSHASHLFQDKERPRLPGIQRKKNNTACGCGKKIVYPNASG
ncbi:hypothetical protein K523DRAFT_422435 [Schizophyllum commune Tattone D]|nr:hypothetical protein K523DRAFT_422435 [Schizophyllum commune Tattone D]